ncbi:hypothetical protein SAMN04487826_2726 [Prevotella sp. khp1]|uniref:hypothetical protein n=1 Tax=Prevotellaceae TaxID=171552 RepID=UPI000881674A|nr:MULTISPECIES: hypothetical protein [Prevotellaceae]QVJ81985.1 hypothetical protein J4031_06410 [Xylanibacter ruminicola]SDQ79945.1 hypothetical protein SAMN04487826_2726 [Prevotella sp. khp1]
MKKKIINGILMVALVGATSTSFVSCKDTSEDVKTDLMAQVNAVKANLEPRVEQAEKDIDALEGRMTTAEGDIKTLKSDVTSLKNRVSTLEQEKDSLAQVTKTIEGQLTQVESKISTIVEALSKMVTSVTVNATSTSILENSKLFPGLNIQFLGTAMGKATTTGKFPSTTTMEGHGTALEAADFAGVKEIYKWSNGDILPKADEDTEVADAGTLWFSLNPSNVVATDLKALKLVDSQGNESFVTINKDSVKVDDETVLSWGVTRGAEFNLWKVQAGINLEATDLATIDPVKIIDYKSIASDVRSMMREIKAAAKTANSSNYAAVTKTTAKDVLKNSTQIVASLLKAKVPSLPALALQAQWEDTVGVRSVLSDFSIAATAYKPLSFDFGKDLIEGRTISLDKADKAAAKIIDKVMDKINRAGVKIQAIPEISFDDAYSSANLKVYMAIDATGNVLITNTKPGAAYTYWDGTAATAPGAGVAYYTELDLETSIKTVTNAIPVAELNALIAEAKQALIDITAFADRTKTFEARVSDFLERELNRVVTKVSTDGLTRILEPIILFQAGENYSVTRFVDGAAVPAGEITLIPTTMTNELLAPAFKKYVAVKAADGSFALQSLKTKGDKDFNKLTVNLKAGNYTVIYSALDFYGNQVSKKYDIVVK